MIGVGAREAALVWKLRQSSSFSVVYSFPGNPAWGKDLYTIAPGFSGQSLPTDQAGWGRLLGIAKNHGISLVVVGPENALAQGIADAGEEIGLFVFGPNKFAAQLESSKQFAKKMMIAAGIPTAKAKVCKSYIEAKQSAEERLSEPGTKRIVLKADGLAAGKGVSICSNMTEVEQCLADFEALMPEASRDILVEEFLEGRECSFFVACDGAGGCLPFGFAVDYKRRFDGDEGPNTGGMGSYSPVPWLPEDASNQVMERVVKPLMSQLLQHGVKYCGWLYVGLMWGDSGPQVIEFNVRLGDPEAQTLAVSDPADWGQILVEASKGQSWGQRAHISNQAIGQRIPTVGIVAVVGSYPGPATKDDISGIWPLEIMGQMGSLEDEVVLFGAGAVAEGVEVFPLSGRVLTVVARDLSWDHARAKAYRAIEALKAFWPAGAFRRDIAKGLEAL